mmetsp:Transcript_9382/g.12159  ORF Transcript_9382/g.12159 Transcript_9382/m.12159 type:complete len:168 (-) Transcript_9382:373-876(-)
MAGRVDNNVLAPFNPVSDAAMAIALELLQLKVDAHEYVYDLGCGDGRFLTGVAKAHSNARCVGIELDRLYFERALLRTKPYEDRVTVVHGDVLDVMLADDSWHLNRCTAVFVYLLPKGLKVILPILKNLRQRNNGRIVSYMFQIPDWIPSECRVVDKASICKVYLYE